jgi:hypothetical protein
MSIWFLVNNSGGGSLQKKFASLGHLSGKSYSQINAVVGSPNAIDNIGEGLILMQWIKGGYSIALLFDQDYYCLGISSESNV